MSKPHCLDPLALGDISNDSHLQQIYGARLKERKLIFDRVKRGCTDTADFLWQKYRLRVWTWEEINQENERGNYEKNN